MADSYFLQKAEECRRAAAQTSSVLAARCFLAAAANFEAKAEQDRRSRQHRFSGDELIFCHSWEASPETH